MIDQPLQLATVFLGFLSVGETQCPAMDLMHIRIAPGRESANEVQRGRSPVVGLDQAPRIGGTSGRLEGKAVLEPRDCTRGNPGR